MKNKIILIALSVVALAALLLFALGYRIPTPDKHSEIPFFPKTTRANLFANKRIDSMYIFRCYPLKGSDYFFASYDKDTADYDTERAVVFTKDLKPAYFLKADYIHYAYDEKNKTLILANDSINVLFDAKVGKARDLSQAELEKAKKMVKTGHGVGIVVGGDIKTHNIKLFDIAVTGNSIKSLLQGSPFNPTSRGTIGRSTGYEDRGIFDKSKYYFFTMKLRNDSVQFKTDLFYNSDVYFDELALPKSDNDTLLYYSNKRLYQLYRK